MILLLSISCHASLGMMMVTLMLMVSWQCSLGYQTTGTFTIGRYYDIGRPSFIVTTTTPLLVHDTCEFRRRHPQKNAGFPLFAAPRQRQTTTGSGGKGKKSPSGSASSASSRANTNSKRSNRQNKKKDGPTTQTPRANTMRHQTANDTPTTMVSTTAATARPKTNAASTKTTPPWNVRSAKDAIQNVQVEKIRRATIKQQQQHATIQSTVTSPTTSDNQISSTTSPLLLSKVFLSNKEQQFIKWKRFKTSDRVVGQRLLHTFFNQTSLQQQIQPNYGVPEIAFIGRSNVGKSSLLNTLSSSTSSSSSSSSSSSTATTMARVGKTPGATASVNMYSLFDGKQKDLIIFTDLPGFGYAKLSKDRQEAIIRTTEQYIYQRSKITKTLALGILLLDIRRTPSQDDIELLETLYDMNVPILVVVTKCDKVSSKYEREQLLNNIQNELQLPQLPLSISSVTGENINLLWQIIFDACDTCIQQMKQIYEAIDTAEDEYYEEVEEDETANAPHGSWYDEQDKSKQSSIDFLDQDDDDDIEYDQGYDWADDNIMLDYDDGYGNNDDSNNRFTNDTFDDTNYDNSDDDSFGASSEELQSPPTQRVTLKSLKRRVKKMQRRGEI